MPTVKQTRVIAPADWLKIKAEPNGYSQSFYGATIETLRHGREMHMHVCGALAMLSELRKNGHEVECWAILDGTGDFRNGVKIALSNKEKTTTQGA